MPRATAKLPAIRHNSTDLKTALFDEINGLRTGATTIARANAVCKMAQQILYIQRMELELAAGKPQTVELARK